MAMYQRKRVKEVVNRMNAEADAKADSLLDKLKASKWTAAILGGVGAFVIVFTMIAIIF